MDCKDLQIRLIAVLRHQMHCMGAQHGLRFYDYKLAQMLGMSKTTISRLASGVQLIDTENLRHLIHLCEHYVQPAETIDQIIQEWIDTCPEIEDKDGTLHRYFDSATDSRIEFTLSPNHYGNSKN